MDGSLAVVTGASAGIGAAMATALAARGHRVLAVARREHRLTALETATGGRAIPLVADLTAEGAAARVAERAADLGGAELLVSNAGVGAFGAFRDIPRDRTLEMLRLNVLAGVELTHRMLPTMLDRRRGGVIVVTSSGGMYPTPNLAAYGGSKAFLLSWGEALAMELRGTGVRAMVTCPGPTATEFGDTAGMADLLGRAPGLAQPDAIARSVLEAWDAGRVLHVPGPANRVMAGLFQRLPRKVTRTVTAAMFRRPAG
ncbi:SDR family NAD(P)-dependent oxidoreductase [Actinomycetospora aeridis]|uniref:SDR family NAD(P)-dependent oxidoreductase n=1 Tax=Actinomycetospora aeridis TaxID=3129231 RepID=A0ABU8N141_9PSEU